MTDDARYSGAGSPSPWASAGGTDLLNQAVKVLAREALRLGDALKTLPGEGGYAKALPIPDVPVPLGLEDSAAPVCPVVGARPQSPGAANGDLRKRAHELLAGLFAVLGQDAGSLGRTPEASEQLAPSWQRLELPTQRVCPQTGAGWPIATLDREGLKRQAHEFIDTLLLSFREATDEDGIVAENKVPLISCAGPVHAGEVARATLTVKNDEPSSSDVSLYTSNFVSDSGYEIPALRITSNPRSASIPARSEARFELAIAVPTQAPAGTYSGLVQAMGCSYVKAVLSVQVL